MTLGFWAQLRKPFFALAPMADVTDAAFRAVIVKYGKPDVMWTEFVSCDGLCSPGKNRLLTDLQFSRAERPIVAQIFGASPAHFESCAALIAELGFDGIDINMGCPDRSVEKQGAGAALIKDPKLAVELIRAARRGAGALPVSVKTRLGYASDILDTWLPHLLSAEPAALTIHARTRKEMSDVPAQWGAVARAVDIVHRYYPRGPRPRVIGNGDVQDLAEARRRAKETGADGIMLGRAIFGNPWLFARRRTKLPSVDERLHALLLHTRLFEKYFSGIKSFDVMKKHYKAYVSGFSGAKELRMKLMEAHNAGQVEKILTSRYSPLKAQES